MHFFSVRDYWAKVREVEATLPAVDQYIFSLEDPLRGLVGGISQSTRESAARAIVNKTHRLATEKEIADHLAEDQRKRERAEEDARRAAGIARFVFPAKPVTSKLARGK